MTFYVYLLSVSDSKVIAVKAHDYYKYETVEYFLEFADLLMDMTIIDIVNAFGNIEITLEG